MLWTEIVPPSFSTIHSFGIWSLKAFWYFPCTVKNFQTFTVAEFTTAGQTNIKWVLERHSRCRCSSLWRSACRCDRRQIRPCRCRSSWWLSAWRWIRRTRRHIWIVGWNGRYTWDNEWRCSCRVTYTLWRCLMLDRCSWHAFGGTRCKKLCDSSLHIARLVRRARNASNIPVDSHDKMNYNRDWWATIRNTESKTKVFGFVYHYICIVIIIWDGSILIFIHKMHNWFRKDRLQKHRFYFR